MPTVTNERAEFERLLNTPDITYVPIRQTTSGEVRITASDPEGVEDSVAVVLRNNYLYNIIDIAPASWWLVSESLLAAIDNRWVSVDNTALTSPPEPVVLADNDPYIMKPKPARTGDLLVYDGTSWTRLPAVADAGWVLTNNGEDTVPSYQPSSGGGGGSGSVLSGQTTGSLITGDVGYLIAANQWTKAQSDGTAAAANAIGAYLGVPNSIALVGNVIPVARFTTAGGAPAVGAKVYLAAAADDGGTGTGKFTATPPTTGFLTVLGTCVDATLWGAAKTCVVAFKPESPINQAT